MNTQIYLPPLMARLANVDLTQAYDYVVRNNPANGLPYHNLFHTQCMALSCQIGAATADLPAFEQRALVLAALFHDYDHSGGLTSDAENIKRACAALQQAAQVLSLPEDLVTRSLALIATTQFPPLAEAQGEAERIIRDGDMCQMLYDSWFEQVYMGLRTEMAHSRGLMTLSQFCDLQRSFFGSLQLHSAWGKSVQGLLQKKSARGVELAERAVELVQEHVVSELDAYAMAEAEQTAKPAA